MITIMVPVKFQLPQPFDQLADSASRHQTYLPRQHVFEQGQPPTALYFVTKGEVILLRHTEAGEKVTLHRATAGDMIAEASLFSSNYHCDCVAVTNATLIAINKTRVLSMLTQDPKFATALVERLAGQVQRYRRRIELHAIKRAEDRVMAGLLDGWLTGSIAQFAGDLSLTHEATYRALAALVRQGRLQKTGRGRYAVAIKS